MKTTHSADWTLAWAFDANDLYPSEFPSNSQAEAISLSLPPWSGQLWGRGPGLTALLELWHVAHPHFLKLWCDLKPRQEDGFLDRGGEDSLVTLMGVRVSRCLYFIEQRTNTRYQASAIWRGWRWFFFSWHVFNEMFSKAVAGACVASRRVYWEPFKDTVGFHSSSYGWEAKALFKKAHFFFFNQRRGQGHREPNSSDFCGQEATFYFSHLQHDRV